MRAIQQAGGERILLGRLRIVQRAILQTSDGVDDHRVGVEGQVVAVLLDHFVTGAPLFSAPDASGIVVPGETEEVEGDDPADADVIVQIKELIETRVRPAVANDGGDIIYRGFREGVVYLAMQGACSGCPSSTATLKNGIETLLKHYVPEVHEVRAA